MYTLVRISTTTKITYVYIYIYKTCPKIGHCQPWNIIFLISNLWVHILSLVTNHKNCDGEWISSLPLQPS